MNAQEKLAFAQTQIQALVANLRALSAPVKPETANALVSELVFWWEEKTRHENAQAFLERAVCHGV